MQITIAAVYYQNDINACSRYLGIVNSKLNDIKITMEKTNKTLNFLDFGIE